LDQSLAILPVNGDIGVEIEAVQMGVPGSTRARGHQVGRLRIGGRRHLMKLDGIKRRRGEHAVEHERVEVDVQVERSTEALDEREAPAPALADTEPACLPALEAQEGLDGDGEHGAAQAMIPGEMDTGGRGYLWPRAPMSGASHLIGSRATAG
jgi:hypothetical protein